MGSSSRIALVLAAAILAASCAGSEDVGDGSGGGAGNGSGGSGNSAGINGTGSGWSGGAGGAAGGGNGGSGNSGTGGGSGGLPAGGPCDGASDGPHCGADLPGADHGTVYTCAGGTIASAESCQYGCSGSACTQPPSDPCASAFGGDGPYCGSSLTGGDPSKLYQCAGGKTASSSTCSTGCQINPPGTPDGCASNDPCTAANGGNGPYCGSSLPGGDPNKLYTCENKKTTSTLTCSGGCKVNPPGTPDACSSGDPCKNANGGNGPYCGSSISGDPNTLYTCTNLVTTGTQACPSGCQQNPPGTPDACKSGGSDPCASANGGNGEYCGASLSGGDSNKLYTCLNGKTSSVVSCPSGCKQNPPGTPDQCASGGSTGGCCVLRPPGAFEQGFTACGNGGSHYGIDYSSSIGTPIYAGISGTVKVVLGFPNCYDAATKSCSTSCYQSSFNYMRIKADCGDPNNSANDLYVYYLHIDSAAVGNGDHVSQGDYVAGVGNSGCSSGPHVHIETVSVPKGTSPSLGSCKSVNPTSRYCP